MRNDCSHQTLCVASASSSSCSSLGGRVNNSDAPVSTVNTVSFGTPSSVGDDRFCEYPSTKAQTAARSRWIHAKEGNSDHSLVKFPVPSLRMDSSPAVASFGHASAATSEIVCPITPPRSVEHVTLPSSAQKLYVANRKRTMEAKVLLNDFNKLEASLQMEVSKLGSRGMHQVEAVLVVNCSLKDRSVVNRMINKQASADLLRVLADVPDVCATPEMLMHASVFRSFALETYGLVTCLATGTCWDKALGRTRETTLDEIAKGQVMIESMR